MATPAHQSTPAREGSPEPTWERLSEWSGVLKSHDDLLIDDVTHRNGPSLNSERQQQWSSRGDGPAVGGLRQDDTTLGAGSDDATLGPSSSDILHAMYTARDDELSGVDSQFNKSVYTTKQSRAQTKPDSGTYKGLKSEQNINLKRPMRFSALRRSLASIPPVPPVPRPNVPLSTTNPFFGTRRIKDSTPVDIKDDFHPFNTNKFIPAPLVSPYWPYYGNRCVPESLPQPQLPPPYPEGEPPSYEEDLASQAAARGYVSAYYPYPHYYLEQPIIPGTVPPRPLNTMPDIPVFTEHHFEHERQHHQQQSIYNDYAQQQQALEHFSIPYDASTIDRNRYMQHVVGSGPTFTPPRTMTTLNNETRAGSQGGQHPVRAPDNPESSSRTVPPANLSPRIRLLSPHEQSSSRAVGESTFTSHRKSTSSQNERLAVPFERLSMTSDGKLDSSTQKIRADRPKGPRVFAGLSPPAQVATPHVDDIHLNLLCSSLISRLSHIRGFSSYFSLLSQQTKKSESPNNPVDQIRGLFSLGIPLCYIFDLLPVDEGFSKINMSQFNAEEYNANPTREKDCAIALLTMQLSSEKVRQTIPGCVPFSNTDISGSSNELVKVINTMKAIIDYLPPDVFDKTQSIAAHGPGPTSKPPMTLTQCQTADAAFNHARMTEPLISDALARSQLDGLYYIQVGFNEELIARGQGTLEEIYIYIDSEIRSYQVAEILARLSQTLSPFPGVLYTPENSYFISPYLHRLDLSESESWAMSKETGVFREGLEFSKSTVNGRAHVGVIASGGSASNLHGQSNSAGPGRKGKGRDMSGASDGEDGFDDKQDEGGDGSGGGDGNSPIGMSSSDRAQGLKNLSIPFYSKLVIKNNKHEVLSRFTSSAVVNVKLAEIPLLDTKNGASPDSHPDGWFGPWFSIQLPFVKTNSSDTVHGNVRYNMSVAQVRVVASSCLSSFISFSPGDSYSVEDPIKSKSERNYTGGGWATLSGTPGVKVGGSTSQTSGQEASQKRWEIVVSPSSGTKTEKSIIWKYVLNDKYHDPQPIATFQPGPSVNFGYKLHARRPKIEVELVVHWSASPDNTQPRLRQWFSSYRSKESPQPPSAFMNLLHQVSVSVDLRSLHENAWVVGLNPDLPDEETLPEFHGLRQFEPIQVNADSIRSNLNCEVTLQRALHGCIQLNKYDRTSDQPLLPSLLGSNTGSALTQPTLSPPVLPTPPRSPLRVHRGVSQ